MELRIYNSNMEFLGIIDNYTSLLWTRKYYETGTFELQMPFSLSNYALIEEGNLIWKDGSKEAGVIEYITQTQDSTSNVIKAQGRFLSSYLDRRLIKGTYSVSNGKVEEVMQALLNNATAIPKVECGELQGYTETVTFQATYKNLLTYEQKLSKYADIAYRLRPDFIAKKIYFETYRGLDRTLEQSDRERIVFSEGFNNLQSATYTYNTQLEKNVCYVGGEGEGSARTIVIAGDDTLTGLARKEEFLSATDISSDDMTTADYQAALLQRGVDKLNEDAISESFESSCYANSNFQYKTDYDLGDIVTIKKESWGFQINLRITQIQETYENESMKVELTFGTTIPETIDWTDL